VHELVWSGHVGVPVQRPVVDKSQQSRRPLHSHDVPLQVKDKRDAIAAESDLAEACCKVASGAGAVTLIRSTLLAGCCCARTTTPLISTIAAIINRSGRLDIQTS
jgi:hypothetical protein